MDDSDNNNEKKNEGLRKQSQYKEHNKTFKH